MAKKRSKRNKAQQSDESSDIDFSALANRLKKVPIQTWVLLLLLLIPIFLAAYFRAYPATLPVTDQWADNSIKTNARNILDQQVRVNFPNLPAQNRAEVVDEEWAKLVEKNQALIYDPQQGQVVQVPYDQALAGYSASFKQSMKNDQGETYLLAIDPWTYYMVARNIATNGHAGDTLKDGKPWNSYAGAPYGGPADNNLHSHIQYYTYKVLKIFKPGISVMGGAFWVPLIIAALSVIPAFFIVRRKAGIFGGFVAATIIAVHGAYLGRTPAGFSDTDAYNVFFPLLVAWLFLEALETKDLKKKLILAGGAGLALGVYSTIWVGWWYIFDIILMAIVCYIGFVILKQVIAWYRKQGKLSPKEMWDSVKGTVMLTAIFVVVTGTLVSFFFNLQFFLDLPLQAIKFSQLKVAANPNLWPNVLTTVAELNEVSFAGVVGQMGGKFLYALALIGVASALLPFKRKIKGKDLLFIGLALLITVYLISDGALQRSAISYLILLGLPLLVGLIMLLFDKRDIDVKYALLILIWFIVSMYATTRGVRFTLVLVPAFGVAIGTLLGMLHKHLSDILSKELEFPKTVVIIGLGIVLCLVLLAPVKQAHAVALNEVPSMNDAWYNSLTGIRDNSAENAIITSWWDFGHWFKSIAQRPVTFDGGSQNSPMAHWVGKLLLTTDEEESIGILRMLDCGSYFGFNTLREALGEPPEDSIKTKALMDELVLLDHDAADARLEAAGLDADQREAVLALTHCEPPEAFLITSTDMVGKAGVWGHFGSWTFERAYIYNTLRKMSQAEATDIMMQKFNYTREKAERTYVELQGLLTDRAANNWISPWPGYISGWVNCQRENGSINTTALGKNTTVGGELERREIVSCPTSIGVGNQQGTDIKIEAIFIDPSDPELTRFRYGFYQNNVRVGGNDEGKPSKLVFAHTDVEDGLETITLEGSTSGVAALFDEEKNRVLFADPLHVGSIFTQLFYLDGKYNKQYLEFSDKNSFNGQRIIVWSVDWNPEENDGESMSTIEEPSEEQDGEEA